MNLPAPHAPVSRMHLRLMASLLGHALQGEPVDDPVLLRRLNQLTNAIRDLRQVIARRGNGLEEQEQIGLQNAEEHAIARALADMAHEVDGIPFDEALYLAANALKVGACDDMAPGLQLKYAERIGDGEAVERRSTTWYKRPEPAFAGRTLIAHQTNSVVSEPADGRPAVIGDPMGGRFGSPEPAALEQAARFGTEGSSVRSRIDSESAASALRQHTLHAATFEENVAPEEAGFRADFARRRASVDGGESSMRIDLGVGWPSLSGFNDLFATRCRTLAQAMQKDDPERLKGMARSAAEKVGFASVPDALIDLVIAEVQQLHLPGR